MWTVDKSNSLAMSVVHAGESDYLKDSTFAERTLPTRIESLCVNRDTRLCIYSTDEPLDVRVCRPSTQTRCTDSIQCPPYTDRKLPT